MIRIKGKHGMQTEFAVRGLVVSWVTCVCAACTPMAGMMPAQIGNPLVSQTSSLFGGFAGAGSGAAADSDAALRDPTLSPAERRMREQSRAFQKTIWEGVLIGAGAGALWGLIQGDDASKVVQKAAIGAAVGGLAGAYIGHKQKQYASREDVLASMTADVRDSNAEMKGLIASVREVIKEDRRKLADLQKRRAKGLATEAELTAARKRVSGNLSVIAQAHKGGRDKFEMFDTAKQQYRQRNPGVDVGSMQKELDSFGKQLDTLDGLQKSLSLT